jgi:hypothetical protein
MFNQENTPPSLWERAQALNEQSSALTKEISAFQAACHHDWQRITWKSPEYWPRSGKMERSTYDLIKEFCCSSCNLRKSLLGSEVHCHLCGGEMKYNRCEHFVMDEVYVHKCQKCGHEYYTL